MILQKPINSVQMNKDIIISAMACGGKMSCTKQAEMFKDPPIVIPINSSTGVSTGGGTVKGFRKAASIFRKQGNGSILDGVLKSYPDIVPNRICLVSYLEGWSFIHELLWYDSNRIDTVIVLEGINTRNLQPWWIYSIPRKSKLWIAHTQSPHKISSCKSSAEKIVQDHRVLNLMKGRTSIKGVPDYVIKPVLDNSISIYSKSEIPKTKIYHEDPLLYGYGDKNKLTLCYNGKQTQDQIYIQQYVQPRLWKWLSDEWK